jgi:uncharacterized protein
VLWKAARDQRYQLLVSPEILREMARVLRDDFNWQEERVQLAVRRVAQVARLGLIFPRTAVHAILADPDDDHVVACAVDGKADLIVSNDRHLLDLKEYAGIPIVRSVDLRRTLGLI